MWVLLNVLAWNSTAFCDAYICYVFPVWVNLYGRVTGIFPFSVGEWMIGLGLLLVAVALALLPVAGIREIFRMYRDCMETHPVYKYTVKRTKFGVGIDKFLKKYYIIFAWILNIVCLIMTLNCFILYHASTFSEKYFGEGSTTGYVSKQDPTAEATGEGDEESLRELMSIRNIVAEQCNILSGQMERDGRGNIVYSGSVASDGRQVDMHEKARELMQQLGQSYPQLDGWYPKPKPLFYSDFMCQQYMQGYYFPFSMEANYNDVMNMILKPGTMCHELAHLRGFIFEDEANFISYLACIRSDDPFFQYSGYLSVLNYLNNDIFRVYRSNPELYRKVANRIPPVEILDVVWEDNTFVSEEEWERIDRTSFLDTDMVETAADVYIDMNLKANGVSDGSISYSRVVELLLLYYRTADNEY